AAEGTERVNGTGSAPPVVIDGPDTVIAGEQARYRVRPSGNRKVVAWAVGGGSVSQAPDPRHPDELLLIASPPGDLTIIVRPRRPGPGPSAPGRAGPRRGRLRCGCSCRGGAWSWSPC